MVHLWALNMKLVNAPSEALLNAAIRAKAL